MPPAQGAAGGAQTLPASRGGGDGQLGQRQTSQQAWGGRTSAQGALQGAGRAHAHAGSGVQTSLVQVSLGLQSASVVQAPHDNPQLSSQLPGTSTLVPKAALHALVM